MSLCDRSAVELRSLIASKEISPVELLASCLERIDAVNPTVNAIVALDREAAVGAAQAAEKAVLNGADIGPLHGLPIGIKDLNDTKGLRTTYGAVEFSDHVPLEDEPMVADIRRAGGIILGKTNTPEFGSGANTLNDVYGFTGNAFDPELSAAGSSGGSAVALACSMVPLASGSDLGGSLRVPASFNGVVGFRSTPGLVGDTKKSFPWWPLSVEGPMGRSVADAALLLSAQVGERPGDALSWPGARPDFTALPRVDLSHLKVAFSQDLGFAPIDQPVRDLFDTRVRAFGGLFAESDYETPPLEDIDRIFQVLRAVGYLAKNHDRLQATPGVVGPNVTANTKLGLKYSALDVALALKD